MYRSHYKKGTVVIMVIVLIMLILGVFSIVSAFAFVGDRSGAMSGSGTITGPSGTAPYTGPTSTPRGEACGLVAVDRTYITLGISSNNAKMMPPAANDFNQLAAEYFKATGKKLYISSMFRSREQQEYLYRTKPGLANAPGNSMHEAGLAMDIGLSQMTSSDYETFKSLSLRYNFAVNRGSRGVKGAPESWHFDYTGLKSQGYWYGNIPAAIDAVYNC